ncbi:MAG: hypothetical protein WAM70_19955, partial [Pyrinomonadaceae bacterium]
EDRVREQLRFMAKPPDEPVTREIALEICERQKIKAMLIGTISGVGNRYVILLEAVNATTGDTIATDQAEADNKEQVLKKLGQAASSLREQLGESLATIQGFNAPIEQVTTENLEALRYYSLGLQQHSSGHYREAIPFYRKAIGIDQRFAIAHARLATCYNNLREYEAARAAAEKAYEYRDRASEREKLFVEWNYFGAVTGEIDDAATTLEVWKTTYPRDWEPHNLLAVRYTLTGPLERAVTEASEAARLNESEAKAHANLGIAFLGLNKFDEAKKVLENAMRKGMETESMHTRLFQIAFVKGDAAGRQQQLDWAGGKAPLLSYTWQAQAAAFYGQVAKANQFGDQVIESAERNDWKDTAAQLVAQKAIRAATFRDCSPVSALTTKALSFSRDLSALHQSAHALAACGQNAAAESLVKDMQNRFAKDTLLNTVSVPLIRAQLALARGDSAQAIQLLESARNYEVYGDYWPQYVRAQAYLKQRSGAQAVAEFRYILDRRGWYPMSPIWPLAHLGLARAYALVGDNGNARKTYQDFFDLWKNADATVPFVAEARQEYDKLK